MRSLAVLSIAALLAAAGAAQAQDAGEPGFFITSIGSSDGANLGGLAGADAHCASLAEAAGLPARDWRAYLSAGEADGQGAVNARDRIGTGPWHNVNGALVAENLDDLHGEAPHFTKQTAINELGQEVNGRGDEPNQHDILTGATDDGLLAFADDGSPATCSDWTSNGAGAASVGHHDRVGGGPNPTSLNASHNSRGCSQSDLEGTGGAGFFYCFAAD